VWSDDVVAIPVNINPPYWATLWFKALAVIVIVGLLFGIYYIRVGALKRQKRRLERIIQQRTEEIVAQNEQLTEQQEELEVQRSSLEIQNKAIEEKNALLENQQMHLQKLVDERTVELLEKNMELEDKNQRFEQYGFMTSHNFRGPVATLLGLCNVFNRKDPADPQNVMLMEMIEETTKRIDAMIKDMSFLLDQDSHVETLYKEMNLAEVLEKTKSLLEREIRESHATIHHDFSAAPVVSAVPAYLTSIFYNLISNGIKFRKESTPPEIYITSMAEEEEVTVHFRDNGCGIDMRRHSHTIFRPFKRFHTHVAGKGLGLYLVKAQARAMHGDIQVESEESRGTTFRVVLKNRLNGQFD
jgi:signal transduction histidine kinase